MRGGVSANPQTLFAVGSVIVAYGDTRVHRKTGLATLGVRDLLRDRVMEAHPSTHLVRRDAVALWGLTWVTMDTTEPGPRHDWYPPSPMQPTANDPNPTTLRLYVAVAIALWLIALVVGFYFVG
jgi:hypothetical protein